MTAARARTGRGTAHGKAIVCGEHFVLDGAHAVAVGLPTLETTVQLEATDGVLQLVTEASLSESQRRATQRMIEAAWGSPPRDLRASIRSSIPIGRGFGSSAALSVSLCRAIAGFRGESPDADALLASCRAVEDIVHGRSSGLDPAAAMSGGGVLFRDGAVVEKLAIARNDAVLAARWLLIDVGEAPPTKVAIARANAARARLGAEATARLVGTADRSARAAANALRDGDIDALSDAMRTCGEALAAIDVVDERMRQVEARALAAGVVAIKQTGAGLGGAMLALAPNPRITETVAAALAVDRDSVHIVPLVA